MTLWITLAILSAVLFGGYEVAKKVALDRNAVFPVLFLNIALGAAICVPFSLLSALTDCLDGTAVYVPRVSAAAHAGIFVKAAIVLASWVFAYFAMKNLPIILTTAIKSTQPVFTLIGAILIFAEQLNDWQWAGVLLSSVALTLFSMTGRREGVSFARSRWVGFIFLATLLGAANSLLDKYLVLSVDKVAVQVWTAYYELALVVPLTALLWWPRRRHTTPFRWNAAIVWVTVLLTVSDFFYFYSLSLDGALVSVIATVRKAGVVVPFVAGVFLFREKNIAAKAALLGLVLIGMYLLSRG